MTRQQKCQTDQTDSLHQCRHRLVPIVQHALVQNWEQDSQAEDLERVLDWALVQGSVIVSGWALEPVLAMGSALVLDWALVPQLEMV